MQKKSSEKGTEEAPIQKIPAANEGAVNFLSLIGANEIKPCLFEESLVAISESGQTIGNFSISVKMACYSPDEWEEEDCYLVHATSKVTIDGVPCTTTITGYITKRLETVEQHTKESVRNNLGFQKQQVGKEEVDVFVIERTVHSEDDIPLNWQFYLLSDGHLSRRVQVGSPATMVILQMPVLIEIDKPDPRPVFGKIPLDWEEDVELYSIFLDRKEELQASHATYVRRHPELTALLADFLQLLLLRKPDDVVTFAAEFFAPFSAQNPPCRSFQSSDKPSPFRSHV